MLTVTLVEANTTLDNFWTRSRQAKKSSITRHGRQARAFPRQNTETAVPDLSELRAKMPRWRKPSHILLREMHDEET